MPAPKAKEWLMFVSSVGCSVPSLAAAICSGVWSGSPKRATDELP